MRGRFAPYLVGIGLLGLMALTLLFTLYALLTREPWTGFAWTAAVAGAVGGTLWWLGHSSADPSRRESLIGVVLLWLAIPTVGALPYVLTLTISPIDALFEAMSGFTATGATALKDFAAVPGSLFLYRAISQWFGGVGIIVLFIAVFPQLAIAGRQLFFAEAPGPTEDRLTPRLRNTAGAVATVYLALTGLCILAYLLAGMSLYDAVAHAFTTVAAAGFSPEARSFEAFTPAVQWVAVVFMLLAGISFALQYRAFSGRPRELLRDTEFRAYLTIVAVASALLTLALLGRYDTWDALRHGVFQVLSILTTTGYATLDYGLWEPRAQVVLVVLMFIGGSAGSAAGGVKIIRWLIIAQNTNREVRRALHPRAVMPVRVGRQVVPESVLRGVAAFIALYLGLFVFTVVVLVALGAGFLTAFTAAVACIGNVGPGLAQVGPMGSFADLHPVSRLLLIFGMYAGRLEIVTVFVVFTPSWWRLPRQNPLQLRFLARQRQEREAQGDRLER